MSISSGKFITLEGTEGAGKSTNLKFIESWLQQKGIPMVMTREPGGTPISEAVRGLLLNNEFTEMTPDTELLLMFAARNQHIEEKIKPALKQGYWVVSDRFTDASYAYQGAARGIDFERLSEIEDWVQKGFQPNQTFVFDLPIEIGMERVRKRGGQTDRFEQEKADFFEKVRGAYLHRASLSPSRYSVLDAAQSLERVQSEIALQLQKLLDNA